jgi:hypothetical protein
MENETIPMPTPTPTNGTTADHVPPVPVVDMAKRPKDPTILRAGDETTLIREVQPNGLIVERTAAQMVALADKACVKAYTWALKEEISRKKGWK